MHKTRWIAVLVVTTSAASLAGFTIGRSRNVEEPAAPAAAGEDRTRAQSGHVRSIVASLGEYRKALAEKDRRMEELRARVDDLQAQLTMSHIPEDYNKYCQWRSQRERRERTKVIEEKTRELRRRIFQRKDRVLREQGLDELGALLQSENPEEVIAGLKTVWSLREIILDARRFTPQVLNALEHDDPSVREAALVPLWSVLPREEVLDIAIALSKDPSPGVRSTAALWLRSFAKGERRDEVIPILRELVHDEDRRVWLSVLGFLWEERDVFEEAEDLVIKVAKEEGYVLSYFGLKGPLSERIARGFVQQYDEGRTGPGAVQWTRHELSDEAKPVAIDFCLRVVRDGIDPQARTAAFEGLSRIGDTSVIPQLEQIANSRDAEGVEEQLQRTIAGLRNNASEPR